MNHFQKLQSINLVYNDIDKITDLSELNSLNNLDISNNNISTYPYPNLNKLNDLAIPLVLIFHAIF